MARNDWRTAQGQRGPALHIKLMEPRLLSSTEPMGDFLPNALGPLPVVVESAQDRDPIKPQQAITGQGQPS